MVDVRFLETCSLPVTMAWYFFGTILVSHCPEVCLPRSGLESYWSSDSLYKIIQTKKITYHHNILLLECIKILYFHINKIPFQPNISNLSVSLLFLYQQKTQSQLWISGLCPSAYWIGQALVDTPLYCSILLSVYLINCITVLELKFPPGLMFVLVSDHFLHQAKYDRNRHSLSLALDH